MSAAAPRRGGPGPAAAWLGALDPLFVVFVIGLLVRCLIGPDVLDRLYAYDLPGGSPAMKIHPGSYLIFATAGWALLRPADPAGSGLVLPAALLAAIAILGAGWTVITDNATAIGALFDLYLVAAAGLFTISRFSLAQKRRVFAAILMALAANAAVLVAEFVLQRRLITLGGATTGGTFRPAGFLGHPLINGVFYATLAPLAVRLRAPLTVRVALSGLIVGIVFISGARFASIVSLLVLPITTLAALRAEPGRAGPQRWGLWLQLLTMALGAPLLILAGLAGGLGYRFTNSLIDQSSLKRIDDYQLLNYLSPHEWWFGGSILASQTWSKTLFGGDSVESPLVVGVFTYGLPMTVVLLGLVCAAVGLLAWRSGAVERVGLAAFLICMGAGNGLMVKSALMLFAMVLIASVGGGAMDRRVRPIWKTFRAPSPPPRWRRPDVTASLTRSTLAPGAWQRPSRPRGLGEP